MLLIDIGSTYTKLVVADIEKRAVIATANSPTTIEDVSIGFHKALEKIKAQQVDSGLLEESYASSSAAGGLRMVAIGLVPALTMEAAKRAALGAGAKVVGTFSFMLTARQVKEIENLNPDIILLAGGTDGGEMKTVIHNAKVIATSELNVPVVMAGNRVAVDEVVEAFAKAGKYLQVADNVMPAIDRLNVESVRNVIREIFIKRIIVAKGLSKINKYINGIALPTPLAVLEAAKTLSEVVHNGVVVVDVGGATTDVHSVADGMPQNPQVTVKGLPEPYAKRTVEGDLGVRHNIRSIIEAIGEEKFFNTVRDDKNYIAVDKGKIQSLLKDWAIHTSILPESPLERKMDYVLASSSVKVATDRHVGYLEEMWTPEGKILIQYGKDLSGVKTLIGTGGPIINSENPRKVLEKAAADVTAPLILKPKGPKYYIDKNYILFSIGLIRQVNEDIARDIAKHYLRKMEVADYGTSEQNVDR